MKLFFKHALHLAVIFTLIFFSYWSFGAPVGNDAKKYISCISPIYEKLDKVIVLFMSGKDGDGENFRCIFSEKEKGIYYKRRPLFLAQLDDCSDAFIDYLDAVGFFTYSEYGYSNEFDIYPWIKKLEAHGAFFLALMNDGVAENFYKSTDKKGKTKEGDPIDWLKLARDEGQDTPMWQICEQFGIKGNVYDDLVHIDKGDPSNSIARYAKSVQE